MTSSRGPELLPKNIVPNFELYREKRRYIKKEKARKESSLALKPRTDVTRSPKQGYQWPYVKDFMSSKNFKKRRRKIKRSVSLVRKEARGSRERGKI